MMTTNNHRKLTKGFWPVLLLSAALSLPAVSVAAPSPNGKAHAADKHNKNNQNKGRAQVRKELQKNQRQAAKQQAEIRRDAQKRQAEVRRDTQKRQAELKRQAAQQRQAQAKAAQTLRQSQARRLELQRQAEIQRQAELRRQAQIQRQAQLQRQYRNQNVYRYNDRNVQNRVYRNRVYRDDSYYRNRFGRYGYRSNGAQEHLDGFVIDDRGECVLFREHSTGQIFALAGNIGDMREGDHIRYVGVHTYDEYCGTGYPTMEVREIKTVWDSDRHTHAIFDANRDGYYGNWADRYYGGYGY
ncbi:MAG TPA: hypothetical protein VF789_20520 [Thermoanaerobaculia bacterium]